LMKSDEIMEATMQGHPIDDRKPDAVIKADTAIKTTTIGQIISALDDRNVLRALRLLEPATEGAEPSAGSDQPDGPRCMTCVTHGE
jgi:hypothetical protein